MTETEHPTQIGRAQAFVANRFSCPGGVAIALGLCLGLALLLRILAFPHLLSPVQADDIGYLGDGLMVAEGGTPGFKMAPNGPLDWFVASYAGLATLGTLLEGSAEIGRLQPLLRPGAALEAALFRIYADMSGLRIASVACIMLISLAGCWAAVRFGRAAGGTAGAFAGGLLAAALPAFLIQSVQAGPYAIAWAAALVAAAAVGGRGERAHPIAAGVLLGLAVGSRIEVALVWPVLSLLQWRRAPDRRMPWREGLSMTGAAAIAFLVVAPWYVPHLIGNLRVLLSASLHETSFHSIVPGWISLFKEGALLPLVVAIIGVLFGGLRQRRWPDVASGVWLLLVAAHAYRPSPWGIRHDGAFLVSVILLTPVGLANLTEIVPTRHRALGRFLLVGLISAPALVYGTLLAAHMRRGNAPDAAVAWVEQHIAAGARVYVSGNMVRALLPTAEASERLWTQVRAPDAWEAKYRSGIEGIGLGNARLPRALSEEWTYQDIELRRRYYILGAPLLPKRPRYNLWIVSEGSFYDMTPSAAVDLVCREGGVYIMREPSPDPRLPSPAASWIRPGSQSTYVYVVAPNACPSRQ